ncbi:MAG: MATE family efflux transporter [Acidimicrobiales bacterium]
MSRSAAVRSLDGEIARLAFPALGALIAEPLYVLADTAVVGNLLGTNELAGLSVAGQTLLTVHAIMVFLAYGTTAAVSRLLGAGEKKEAAHQAVQGLWLAAGMGVILGIAVWFAADPLLRLIGETDDGNAEAVLSQAKRYLVVSLWGLPAMLIALSGVGYLRGLQDTVRPLVVAVVTAIINLVLELVLIVGFDFEIGASAFATVVAQWLAAGAYLWWIGRDVTSLGVRLLPDFTEIVRLLRVGANLFIRTVALRGSFTVSVAAASRISTEALAAHEIAFQLFVFTALALDSVAIAGQSMMGRFLGADDEEGAHAAGRRVLQWGLGVGLVALVIFGAGAPFLPDIFTNDAAVAALATTALIHLALMQPLNGLVFALDGVLIGAGDMRFLALAMAGAAIVFVPLALAVPALGLGLGWLWGAIWVLMVVRGITLWQRFTSERWVVTGAR